MLLTN